MLAFQTANEWHCGLRHASKGLHQGAWRLSMDTSGDRFAVSALVGKNMQRTWFFLFVAIRRSSQIIKKKVRSVIECSNENFVPVVAVVKQKGAPSIEFSTAKGNLEREQEVEDTMLDL